MGMDGSASKRSVLRTGLGEFVSLFDMDDPGCADILSLFFKVFFFFFESCFFHIFGVWDF